MLQGALILMIWVNCDRIWPNHSEFIVVVSVCCSKVTDLFRQVSYNEIKFLTSQDSL